MSIISPADISTLARPCYADTPVAMAAIIEAETMDIRPRLGTALYNALSEERCAMLLNGGDYTDSCGATRSFVGIKTALAYYAYARIVRQGGLAVTRYGVVRKEEEYSDNAPLNERMATYNECFALADEMLNGCLEYVTANASTFPEYEGCGRLKNNRIKYRIIGE
jgi:hypothetical protein